jgi:hypothetical protein
MTRLIYAPRRPDALSEDAARTMFGQAVVTDRDGTLVHYVDVIYRERQALGKQRSLLALVPATKGRNRIIAESNPLMAGYYERMRSQIQAVK